MGLKCGLVGTFDGSKDLYEETYGLDFRNVAIQIELMVVLNFVVLYWKRFNSMSMTMGSANSTKIRETECRRTFEPKSITYIVNANFRLLY